jgi:hypothetical protein
LIPIYHYTCMKSLSAITAHREVMNPHNGRNDNNKKDTTKAIAAAIPLAGILVAAALLSGLTMIGNYQPAIAQNVTAGGNATTTTSPTTAGAGNTTGSACVPQTGGANATTTEGGANATTTEGGVTNGTEGTTLLGTTIVGGNTTAAGGNQTTGGSPTQLIEQACIAAQNNDTQGVLMNLNAALNALSANATTTADDAEDDDDGGEEEGEA